MNKQCWMKHLSLRASRMMIGGLVLAAVGGGSAGVRAADVPPEGHAIAYAIYDIYWAVYQTKDGKEECPNGLNEGPREEFAALYPDGTKRTMADTQLAREAEIWWPATAPDRFPIRESSGKVGIGLNLDGKIKPTDFTSPEGVPGIDNQLQRVLGCVDEYRDGDSVLFFERSFLPKNQFDRLMIEVTHVDSLTNDDDVTITTYRGRDRLLTDASGNGFVPGSTQRIDMRWSKEFVHQAKGRIVDGVLTSEPLDVLIPGEIATEAGAVTWLRDGRFQLKLTPERAEGLLGGYVDVESFYRRDNRTWSTHFHSYGHQPTISIYKAMHRLADAHPNPTSGANTAISSALNVKMVQVRALHPNETVSEIDGAPGAKQVAHTRAGQ